VKIETIWACNKLTLKDFITFSSNTWQSGARLWKPNDPGLGIPLQKVQKVKSIWPSLSLNCLLLTSHLVSSNTNVFVMMGHFSWTQVSHVHLTDLSIWISYCHFRFNILKGLINWNEKLFFHRKRSRLTEKWLTVELGFLRAKWKRLMRGSENGVKGGWAIWKWGF